MSLTVYSISGSPSAWRVLLGLAFKGLDYELRSLKLSENEHKSEAYLAIHPRGTVPALVADGQVVRDSIAILAWLDRAYPQRPLFGTTAGDAHAIWQATMENAEYLRAANKPLLTPIFFQGATQVTPALAAAAGTMRAELDRLDTLLASNDFIADRRPSAADAVTFPEIRLVQRAMETKPELLAELGLREQFSDHPRVRAWVERVNGLDGVDATLPSHWS